MFVYKNLKKFIEKLEKNYPHLKPQCEELKKINNIYENYIKGEYKVQTKVGKNGVEIVLLCCNNVIDITDYYIVKMYLDEVGFKLNEVEIFLEDEIKKILDDILKNINNNKT